MQLCSRRSASTDHAWVLVAFLGNQLTDVHRSSCVKAFDVEFGSQVSVLCFRGHRIIGSQHYISQTGGGRCAESCSRSSA